MVERVGGYSSADVINGSLSNGIGSSVRGGVVAAGAVELVDVDIGVGLAVGEDAGREVGGGGVGAAGADGGVLLVVEDVVCGRGELGVLGEAAGAAGLGRDDGELEVGADDGGDTGLAGTDLVGLGLAAVG